MNKVKVPVKKYDRRRKYYMVLDCETATLPWAARLTDPKQKQAVAIAKPLIYDLGWQIIDKKGRVYARKNYLISEIFSVPAIFDTAYYASKRPIYLEKLEKGEIILTDWKTAAAEMVDDMKWTDGVGAYNAMFDYKKAIPFTELYISKFYSPELYSWIAQQEKICAEIASGRRRENTREFEPDVFRFRGVAYPMFDLWGLSCKHILNDDKYKQMCVEKEWQTASGKYFKTSAETTFRFVVGDMDFIEAHTAIDDAIIESEIFAVIVKKAKNKVEMGIEYFPFRILGTVENFLATRPEL